MNRALRIECKLCGHSVFSCKEHDVTSRRATTRLLVQQATRAHTCDSDFRCMLGDVEIRIESLEEVVTERKARDDIRKAFGAS